MTVEALVEQLKTLSRHSGKKIEKKKKKKKQSNFNR